MERTLLEAIMMNCFFIFNLLFFLHYFSTLSSFIFWSFFLGIKVLIDGAHGLFTKKLTLQKLNPDFYTSNFHKWFCGVPGLCFLLVFKKGEAKRERASTKKNGETTRWNKRRAKEQGEKQKKTRQNKEKTKRTVKKKSSWDLLLKRSF